MIQHKATYGRPDSAVIDVTDRYIRLVKIHRIYIRRQHRTIAVTVLDVGLSEDAFIVRHPMKIIESGTINSYPLMTKLSFVNEPCKLQRTDYDESEHSFHTGLLDLEACNKGECNK